MTGAGTGDEVSDSERLGVGTTVIASVIAALIGFGVGVITTFTHAQLPPFGVIVGLAIVGTLVLGFRLVFHSRIVAGAAAVGVLLAIGILALPSTGGSVVVADNPLGYAWVIGPPIVAAAALFWPPIRRRASE